MSLWTYMNIKGQGHSLTLVQGHSDSTFSFFFLETAWPIEVKFYVEPPWDGELNVWSNGLGHMTKMAAMPIYGKNLKKSSSLMNSNLDQIGLLTTELAALESWYAVLGARVLPYLFKWWPWDYLDLFYGMVKFGP